MICRLGLMTLLSLAAFLFPGPVVSGLSQSKETACDRLASDPNDVNKVGPGITFDKIDANDAIAACQQDLRVNPNTARFKFQLARALHKAKRYEEAARLYKSLASSGYAKAAENLAHLYEHGLGVPTDFLVAYVGYRLAVQAGYDYALIELGDLSRRIASEKIESDDFTNKHIEAEFLRDHRDIIKPVVIIRDEQDILAEAAHWYEQAIKKGVPSGILRLAKLHLEADPIDIPRLLTALNIHSKPLNLKIHPKPLKHGLIRDFNNLLDQQSKQRSFTGKLHLTAP